MRLNLTAHHIIHIFAFHSFEWNLDEGCNGNGNGVVFDISQNRRDLEEDRWNYFVIKWVIRSKLSLKSSTDSV